MSDTPYQPNDPLFLLSRGLDEPLTAEEQKALDRALENGDLSPDDARDLRAVDALLRRWKAVSIMTADLSASVMARLDEKSEAGDDALDDILAALDADEPRIDWNRFHHGVMEKVFLARPQWVRPLLRIGAPLALAACLAFAAWLSLWAPSTETVEPARLLVQFDPSSGSTKVDSLAEPRVMVAFGRASLTSVSDSRPLPPISSGWAGATAVNEPVLDVPPL